MDVTILKDEKDVLEIELPDLTLAELLRSYLLKNGANMAAWKREHPSKKPILHIEHSKPKKLLKDTIKGLEKDLDKIVDEFKKLKG